MLPVAPQHSTPARHTFGWRVSAMSTVYPP